MSLWIIRLKWATPWLAPMLAANIFVVTINANTFLIPQSLEFKLFRFPRITYRYLLPIWMDGPELSIHTKMSSIILQNQVTFSRQQFLRRPLYVRPPRWFGCSARMGIVTYVWTRLCSIRFLHFWPRIHLSFKVNEYAHFLIIKEMDQLT